MKFPVDKLATVNVDVEHNKVEATAVKPRNETSKDQDPISETKSSW